MYYSEKYINGVLHCSYSPKGKYKKLSKKQLAFRIVKLEEEKTLLVNRIKSITK